MSRRHAPIDHPPSTAGTLLERATRRPRGMGVLSLLVVVLAAPVVAAQPVAAPSGADRTPSAGVAAATPAEPLARPGEGIIAVVGQVARFVATDSANRANASATYLSASILAARQASEEQAARLAAEEEAARQEAARAEQARRQAEAAPAAPAASNGSTWDDLAACEAGGNWGINTGNGYYGGLQFSLSSWRAVGGTGYPHEASRETQIAMGERLRGAGGWGHWPACARKLGLR